MAAHLQGKHRTAQEQLLASNLKTVLLDIINQLASKADLDYGLYKLEWLCSLVLRLRGTFQRPLFTSNGVGVGVAVGVIRELMT